MKSHTGGATSLGCGAIMCKSMKQKLNSKSSTEAEVVGSSDYLPNTVWARMFLAKQGYKLTENIFYQDNQSAIQLEKNGQASCGQKSTVSSPRAFRRLLSYRRNACRFLYKTSSRQFGSEIPGRSSRSLPCEYVHKISATSIRGAC